jgi:hypothetical protein
VQPHPVLAQSLLRIVVRFLLKEYMEEVDGTLAMNLRSGNWTGSEVSYLERRSRFRSPG